MSDQPVQETVCLASLMIDVKGDFANPIELRLRGKIEKTIASIGIGPCVGSGSGMGMMDMDFLIDDGDQDRARAAIQQAMSQTYPDVKYGLDFTVAEGKREDFLPEKSGCAGAAVLLVLLIIAVTGPPFLTSLVSAI